MLCVCSVLLYGVCQIVFCRCIWIHQTSDALDKIARQEKITRTQDHTPEEERFTVLHVLFYYGLGI